MSRSARVIGLAGSQGSGKSTLSKCVARLAETLLGHPAIVLSLDDFYLPKAERVALADIHPCWSREAFQALMMRPGSQRLSID